MNNPTIVVDIDEVLARHNHALAQWHNENYGTNHTEHSYFTDRWSEVWGIDNGETERRAAAYHAQKVHRKLPVVPGAQDAIKQLATNYDLVVVTVRRKGIIKDTHDWLNEFFPDTFKEVRFIHFWDEKEKTTKAKIAKEIGASYLIDDGLKHCTLAANAGVNAVLFGDYTWNRTDALPTGVHRVKDWKETLRYFYGQ